MSGKSNNRKTVEMNQLYRCDSSSNLLNTNLYHTSIVFDLPRVVRATQKSGPMISGVDYQCLASTSPTLIQDRLWPIAPSGALLDESLEDETYMHYIDKHDPIIDQELFDDSYTCK